MINNKEIEIIESIDMNEKDYITSLLTSIKDIEKNMCVSLTEASNEKLYKKYKEMFDNISNLQRKVFEVMFRLGFYQLEKQDKNKIDKKLEKLSNDYNTLN